MRRHPAFQDLSRDHFEALVAVLGVERAVQGRGGPLDEAAGKLLEAWSKIIVPHFREEEEHLLPVLDGQGPEAAALAERMREDHQAIRDAFGSLRGQQDADPAAWLAAATLLRRHIRWEEESVFEWLQQHLDETMLARLLGDSASFRTEHRGPDWVRPPRP